MPTRKGVSKKELKEPDQFQSFLQRCIDMAVENQKQLYIAAGAFVVLLFLIAGLFTYRATYESRAGDLYAQAFSSYESLEYAMENRPALEDAIAGYELLIETYPRSSAAGLARYNLGNLYHALGSYDRAVEAFSEYLQRGAKRSELKELAYYGLGYSYEELREYEKAIEAFELAAKNAAGEHFRVINYSNLGRIYEKMNDAQEALRYYEKVRDAEKDPLLAGLAARRIATLK